MELREPLGHGDAVAHLWRAAAEERLPHALTFEGPEGIGKFVAARWLAAGILCERGPGRPCLACGPCKRVTSGGEGGNHADLFLIDPISLGEERIRVFRVAYRPDAAGNSEPERCVERFLDLRPLEGRGRVVLMREAHRMNVGAQNALLKTLEEPRPETLLVLETHRSELLLPTIQSRCVRIRFPRLEATACAQVLAQEGSLEGERAERLARWAEGSPGAALALKSRAAEALVALLVGVLRAEVPPLAAAREVWEVEGEFLGKTPTARARDRARTLCELAQGLVRDLARRAAGLPSTALAFGDALADVKTGPTQGEAARMQDVLVVCRADVDRNLAPEAVVERALLVLGLGMPILT